MNKLKYIEGALNEARYFVKDIRNYLCEIEKQRPLTKTEKELWDKTHDIHIHTNDAGMMLQEWQQQNMEQNLVNEALDALSLYAKQSKEIETAFGKQNIAKGYTISEIRVFENRVRISAYLSDRKIRENDEYQRMGDIVDFLYFTEDKKILTQDEYEEICRENEELEMELEEYKNYEHDFDA